MEPEEKVEPEVVEPTPEIPTETPEVAPEEEVVL